MDAPISTPGTGYGAGMGDFHEKVPSAVMRTAYRSKATLKDMRSISPETRALLEGLDEVTGRQSLQEITAGRNSPNDAVERHAPYAVPHSAVPHSAVQSSGASVKRSLQYGSAARLPHSGASSAIASVDRRSGNSWSDRSLSPAESPDIWDSAGSADAVDREMHTSSGSAVSAEDTFDIAPRRAAAAASGTAVSGLPAGRRLFSSSGGSYSSARTSPPIRMPALSPPRPVDFSMSSALSADDDEKRSVAHRFGDATPGRSPPSPPLTFSPVRAQLRRNSRGLPSAAARTNASWNHLDDERHSSGVGNGEGEAAESKFEALVREAKTPSPQPPSYSEEADVDILGTNDEGSVEATGNGDMAGGGKTEQEMIEESERLCRQLMEEEQAAFCQRIEEEQRRAIAAMRNGESPRAGRASLPGTPGVADTSEDGDLALAMRLAAEGEDGEGEEYYEEEADIDPDAMTYDQLLELGEHIGDVAQERWRVDGRNAVASIPIMVVDDSKLRSPGGSHHPIVGDRKCLVCLCDFEEGEELKVLPCRHAFHPECIDGWLVDHKTCVTCKIPIDGSSP